MRAHHQTDQQAQVFKSTGEASTFDSICAGIEGQGCGRFSSKAKSCTVTTSPRDASNPTAACASAERFLNSSAERACHRLPCLSPRPESVGH